MKRDAAFAALLIALLLAVSWLTAKKPEAPIGATRAAHDYSFGGYRAWYELLAREGGRVERFRRHHDALPDERIAALVFAFPADGVAYEWNAGERAALRAWIRAGGRLIDVGITPSTARSDGADEPIALKTTGGDAAGALHGPWAQSIGALAARGTDRIAVKPKHRAQVLLADRAGALVVRYRLGRGEVTSVANAAMFENRALGVAGNARLAFLLARPRTAAELTAFDEAIRGDVIDRPWYLALDVAERVALGFALVAGVLWLLYGITSFGPAVRLRAPREPTSAEFVDAVAALYGRARARDHARDALLDDARRALERVPATPEQRALAQRVADVQTVPVRNDAALIEVARLARLAREEIVRATTSDRRTATLAGGPRAGRRRR